MRYATDARSLANSVVLIERQRASQIAGGVTGKESADTTQTVIGALRKPRKRKLNATD